MESVGRRMGIYSYILQKSDKMGYFTDMKVIFDSLEGEQNKLNWLISDFELSHYPDESWIDEPYIWITGEKLTELIYGNDIQFIWGVFSGFKKGITVDLDDGTFLPYAEGNSRFWVKEPKIQHPRAEMEIVCWDGASTLFLSRSPEYADKFKAYFEEAEDLKEYNSK